MISMLVHYWNVTKLSQTIWYKEGL